MLDFEQDRVRRPEAAAYVGLSEATLEADASRRRLGIPFYRIGARVYYRRSDLNAWLASRRVCFNEEAR